MSKQAVFIFVSAGNCGGCVRFKQNFWEKTKAELAKIPGLRIKEHPVSKLGEPLPPDAHQDLARFVGWYPTFILVSKDSYEKNKLQGTVFNGVEDKSGQWNLIEVTKRLPTDDVTVIKWVKETLSGNNGFFKKDVSFKSLGVKGVPKPAKNARETHHDNFDEDSPNDEIYTAAFCRQAFMPFS